MHLSVYLRLRCLLPVCHGVLLMQIAAAGLWLCLAHAHNARQSIQVSGRTIQLANAAVIHLGLSRTADLQAVGRAPTKQQMVSA